MNIPNNPQKPLWFVAKRCGWGWVPVTWQGWAITIGYVVLVLFFSGTIDEESSRREIFFTMVFPIVLLTTTLIRICYAKGEAPSWRWGDRKK